MTKQDWNRLCEDCREPISHVRLVAVPGAQYCKSCAQAREDARSRQVPV